MEIPYLIEFLFIISILVFVFALMLVIPAVMEGSSNSSTRGNKKWPALKLQLKRRLNKVIYHLQKKRPGRPIFELGKN
tara:strand:- start:305 stop:538 length:234 start_codon:yes stop_codon:yes gene_type:complete